MTDAQQVRDVLAQMQDDAIKTARIATEVSQPQPPLELPPAGAREAGLLAEMQQASGVKNLAPAPKVPDRQPTTWDQDSILADMQRRAGMSPDSKRTSAAVDPRGTRS